jgi:hypothetical protein
LLEALPQKIDHVAWYFAARCTYCGFFAAHRSDLDKLWVVTSALFADLFGHRRLAAAARVAVGRGKAEEMIAAVNELIAKPPP